MSSGRVDSIKVSICGDTVETNSIVGIVGLRKLIKILQVNLKILEDDEAENQERPKDFPISQPGVIK